MGRLMKGAEKFMTGEAGLVGRIGTLPAAAPRGQPLGDVVKEQVDHGRRVEREHLAEDQPADDGDTERPTQLRAHAVA